jgi:hypothetical protein
MILLITSSGRASECAAALKAATGEAIVVAETLARATTLLREDSCLAVVLDQYFLETEPRQAETMLKHLDTAILIKVNLAISGKERLVRDVRTALQCRELEEARAHHAAAGHLRNELNGTVTSLLLCVDLAMKMEGLPIPATEKLVTIRILVGRLREQLESETSNEKHEPAGATRQAD